MFKNIVNLNILTMIQIMSLENRDLAQIGATKQASLRMCLKTSARLSCCS